MKTFTEFQEAALAIPAAAGVASKVLPAAVATVGAIGTFLQAKKKGKDLIKPKKGEVKKTKKLIDKYKKTAKIIKPKEGEIAKQRELLSKIEKRITKPKKGEKKEASKTVKDFLKARKKEGQTMYKLKQDAEIADKGPGDLLPAAKKTYLNKMLDNLRKKKVNEGVAALALKGGSKLIPALMTGIGAAGTIMQIKNPKRSVYTGTRKSQKKERIPTQANKKTVEVAKDLGLDLTDPRQRRKAQSRAIARGLKKQNKTNKKINPDTGDIIKPRYNTKLKGIQIHPKKGEAEATEKLIDKINNPSYLEKVRRNVRKEEIDFVQYIKDRFKEKGLSGFVRPKKVEKKKKTIGDLLKNINTNEEMVAAPTNNASSGAIAGLPPDQPPIKKKKRYIYGGTGSRKMWMNNK